MVKRAAVAVIGGGVIGASVAYHLARRGVRDVLILDRGSGPGNGSTSRATGGFRGQFETTVNVELSLLARDKLRDFSDELGVDPQYVPAGYMWIAYSERALDGLRNALKVQHSAGLHEAREIDADTVLKLNPAIAPDGILGGTFCDTDGFMRPMEILKGYLIGAEREGVRIEWGTEVHDISSGKDSRAHDVETSAGKISVDCVVNAAGAWAGSLCCDGKAMVPVRPLKRQVAVTAPTTILPASMPMTIFTDDGFHLRVRDGRVMLLKATEPLSEDPFATEVETSWMDSMEREAAKRVPCLADFPLDRAACYAGLYEMSPDNHAILGQSPTCENVFLANGSSGHGVMHSPAIGQLMSEIICDGVASSLDISALRPTRFSERALNQYSGLL